MTAIVKRDPPVLAVEKARDMLARARSVDEAKKIRDVAVAMRAYARTQEAGRAIAIDAGEIILRADVRLGQLARELPRQSQAKNAVKNKVRESDSVSKKSALADLKLTKQRASEMERAATLPERDLDRYVEASRKAGQAPSTSAATALAALPAKQREKVLGQLGSKPDIARAIQSAKADAKRAERVEKIERISRGNAPLIEGPSRFPILLADPPWRYEAGSTDPTREIENQYPTMDLDAICALQVAELATPDAILFLWHPPGMATEAVRVAGAWGFRERSSWVWVKERIGPGYWGRLRHEMVMICTRGDFPAPAPSDRPDSVIEQPRGEHSAKPVEVAERIERMWPTLPKVELFARAPRDGWIAWGNQARERLAG